MQMPTSAQARPSRTSPLLRPQEDTIPKYIPAGFITATTFDGNPIRFERRKRIKNWKAPELPIQGSASNLLSRPIHQLFDSVKALQVIEPHQSVEASPTSSPRTDGQMWVDRYRPRKFTDLLGDERVHRDVLGWLKEWDQCVFKRKNMRKERHQQYLNMKNAEKDAYHLNKAQAWKDPYGRPNERVLIISGPPGLGKTTLAHVIANQAGYNVFELNASDARTAGAVQDLVRIALESSSLKDPRPTLVLIDEIDGAQGGAAEGAGFVKALVRLIENGKGSTHKPSSFTSSKKKKGHKPLLRPVICICNDLYAPALRPLRPFSKLVRFNKAPTNLVVKRLRAVCEQEQLQADTRGLSLLSELTGGDIRSCLNALEFAKTKNIVLTEAVVRNAEVGLKDTGTTVHRVWEMLFRTQNSKEKVRSCTRGQQSAAEAALWNQPSKREAVAMVDTPAENVNRLVHEITSCSEYDKLAQGCFQHYPSLRPSDDGWERFHKAHDWLHFGQCLNQKIYSTGTFELLGFIPWSFVPWHLLFANMGNALPEYPKVDYENHLKTTAFNEVVSTLHTCLSPRLRSQFSRPTIITELGPSLMRILTPDLRPINHRLVRSEEKATLTRLVSIMLDLNLRFVQDRTQETDQLVFKLDPPLDVFTQFQGNRSKEVGPARFAVRQLVANEIERVGLRRKKNVSVDNEDAMDTAVGKAMAAYRKEETVMAPKKEKAAVDFFGRPIVKTDPVGRKRKTPQPSPEGVKVFYRYHEGFSNAVRRPVRMSSLL